MLKNADITHLPDWYQDLLNNLDENVRSELVVKSDIVRQVEMLTDAQSHTSDTFGYKWHQLESFETQEWQNFTTNWLSEKYGPVEEHLLKLEKEKPIILDAGCGAGLSGFCYFGSVMDRIRFVGADVSNAVDVAGQRADKFGYNVGLVQADLTDLPFKDETFDLIFSEGVLHHTDSTENAIKAVSKKLSKNGLMMFYVYKKKGPVREYTDDYIRDQLSELSPEEAWKALEPLSKLGIKLGELDKNIFIDEPIDLLGIPAGEMSVQRLFYWNIAKLFYRPEMSFDEINHVNFDWYTPANAHRQTLEEVRQWSSEAGLNILRETVEPAGITIIAQKN